ncbi:hypothetical protein JDV02_003502 [Purpureocillium takamizusanense]|uniref:Uncharacterized protein n=1 Tax=Purpureocillium takamizusanense TaxID=2060973 RepID=A0A9Q8QDC4_9HYPO|nr:uncharacterized protein JDV02_003502 [Purpureocillium takamizusanense]UNI17126.1 hypothetical protein JDV02_003502 [Purpureocillium takamizusanense]
MARPRVPTVYAFSQLFLRATCVALSLATFVTALYATTRYGYGKAVSGAFVASLLALPIDVVEVVALADARRHVARCSEGALCGLDFLTAVICAVVPTLVWLSSVGFVEHHCDSDRSQKECDREERNRREASDFVLAAWMMPMAVAALHIALCVFSCVDCGRRRRTRRRAQAQAESQ